MQKPSAAGEREAHHVVHGFVERVVMSERGGTDESDFLTGDLVLTVVACNLVTAPNGDPCIINLQTTDGR